MTKITIDSPEFKRVEKNLLLENFQVNKQLALKAIDVVNSKKILTPTMIKEALNLEKI
ncbi:Zn-dependent hydrolase [Lysinibacillus sp. 54212]|uniref:Zn-dependent hydrolase n=1 Tax=Lysinibacillus sp. 54212 TaxID=3119829 RepID=UPI002FC790D5